MGSVQPGAIRHDLAAAQQIGHKAIYCCHANAPRLDQSRAALLSAKARERDEPPESAAIRSFARNKFLAAPAVSSKSVY